MNQDELEDSKLVVYKWPHYFHKKCSPMYHSTSVLGKLYDYANLHRKYIAAETANNILHCSIFERYSMELNYIYQGFSKFLKVAEALYDDYQKKIR